MDDLWLARLLVKDLGSAFARVRYQVYKGSTYVVFKGYAGLRQIFTGTRYKAEHVKVVQMGVGRAGAMQAVRGGAILTVVLVSAFRIFDYLMSDGQTLSYFLGTLASDFIKIGVSAASAAASVIAASAVSIATFAVGPLLVAIAVGVGVSLLMEFLDAKFRLTDQLIEKLDELVLQAEWGMQRRIEDAKRKGAELVSEAVAHATSAILEAVLEELEDYVQRTLPRAV